MFGTDTTGAPYYCSSGLVWTAMGGSDLFATVRAHFGISNYPSAIVTKAYGGGGTENDLLLLLSYNPNTGQLLYSGAQTGNTLNQWCGYMASGDPATLFVSNQEQCPATLTATGAAIQYF